MAGCKFQKGSEEWQMFNDFWKLCQEYWEPEENQEYWDKLILEASKFVEKYAAYPLAKEIAMGFVCSTETRFELGI